MTRLAQPSTDPLAEFLRPKNAFADDPLREFLEPKRIENPTPTAESSSAEIRANPDEPRQQLSPAARDTSDLGRFAPPVVVSGEQVQAERDEKAMQTAVADRRSSFVGRFEERLAKTAVGQTLLEAEAGLSDIARGAVSLGARAIGADSVSANIHKEKQFRNRYLAEIEKGSDLEALLGPTGSKIFSGVTRSLAQIGPVGKLSGTVGVYSTVGGIGFDDGMAEAESLGLTGGEQVAYAGKKATWELGVTHLFGRLGKKVGLESLEESLTPGVRAAAAKVGQRLGISEKLTQLAKALAKASGGATLEGVEESVVDAGLQAIERAETPGAKFDLERLLVAGATGTAARSATAIARGISQSLASNKNYVQQTLGGAVAAEKALSGEGGDITANAIAANPPTNASAFAEATGIKRAKPAFREAYLDTIRLYMPASIGEVTRAAAGMTREPATEQISTTEPRGKIKIGATFPGMDGIDIRVAEVFNAADDRIGSLTFSERDDSLRVETAGIDKKRTGKTTVGKGGIEREETERSGAGVPAYEALAARAAAAGKPLTSDASTTQDAIDVWRALEKRGYRVTQNPNAQSEPTPTPERLDSVRMFTEDDTPVFTLDTSVIPTAPAATAETVLPPVAPFGLVVEQRVEAQTPPPPNVHDTLVWNESGALKIPESFSPELRESAGRFRKLYDMTHLSIGGELTAQAKRAPEHQKFLATAMAEELNDTGKRVLLESRKIGGKLFKAYDGLMKRIGKANFNAAALDLQSVGTETPVEPGIVAIEAKFSDYMEGRKTPANKRAAEFVRDYQGFVDGRGNVAVAEGVRRTVPHHRLAARLAELGPMTDAELAAEHKALFPTRKAPSGRPAMIEVLQGVEFFKNPGGDIFNRIGLHTLIDIRTRGEGHPLWAPLSKCCATMNGIDPTTANVTMQQLKTLDKKAAVEIPRIFERFPTSIVVDGKRYDLLETHPFRHVERSTDAFVKRLGVLKVLGDEHTTPDGEAPIDKLYVQAVQSGLDPTTVEAYLNGMAGHSLDKSVADQGGENVQNDKIGHALVGAVVASKLTLSSINNLFEPITNIPTFIGGRRLIRAFAEQIKRSPQGAMADVRRLGAFQKEYTDLTLDRQNWINSLSKVYGNAVMKLGVVKGFWNWQGELAAAAGKVFADDFRTGRATAWDRDNLVRFLGYTEAEADNLFNRTATPDDYVELIQRTASRTNSARITNPIEESRVRGNKSFRFWMPLSRFGLLKARTLNDMYQFTKSEWTAALSTGDPQAFVKAGQGVASIAQYIGSAGAAGALAGIVRSMILYGPEEGLGLELEEWRHNPDGAVLDALLNSSVAGLFVTTGLHAWRRLDQAGSEGIPEAVSSATVTGGIATEALAAGLSLANAAQGKLGFGRYAKLDGPIAMGAAYIEATLPLSRAIGAQASVFARMHKDISRVLLPTTLGQRDLKMDAARTRLFRFLDENGKGPGSGSPGDLSEEQARFTRAMQKFTLEARKLDPLSPERTTIMTDLLFEALDVTDKEPVAIRQSILNRRLTGYFQGDQELELEFATKYPEKYDKIAEHDAILEAWADAVHRPKR